jgi:HD superfamily phosphohydrolase YqeK
MQVMGELAQVYALDSEASLTAGLLHDAAKDLTPVQQAGILLEAKIEIRYECERDYSYYLHGPVGAHYVQRKLGITDPLILTAITTHTYYGNSTAFDAPICWCLRFADILEPTRNWNNVRWLRNGVGRLKEAVYAGRLAEGAFLQTGWLVKWFGEMGVPIHPNMTRIYQDLSAVLDLNDSFLEQES